LPPSTMRSQIGYPHDAGRLGASVRVDGGSGTMWCLPVCGCGNAANAAAGCCAISKVGSVGRLPQRCSGCQPDEALMIDLAPTTTFSCKVTRVHDGDGPLWCSNGVKVRIAGVQAPDFESASPCRAADPRRVNYRCNNAAAKRSQQIVERLVLRQTLSCEAAGKSYTRVVARCTLPDGRSLSCATIASGAAARWDRYWRQYRMGDCR
jgi:endonuclease YncB( thermonuclease family)